MPAARQTDPATSHAAASSVDHITRTQRRIHALLIEFGPMCDHDIEHRYRMRFGHDASPSGLRTRRAELVEQGLVADSLQLVLLPTGRSAVEWQAVRP